MFQYIRRRYLKPIRGSDVIMSRSIRYTVFTLYVVKKHDIIALILIYIHTVYTSRNHSAICLFLFLKLHYYYWLRMSGDKLSVNEEKRRYISQLVLLQNIRFKVMYTHWRRNEILNIITTIITISHIIFPGKQNTFIFTD